MCEKLSGESLLNLLKKKKMKATPQRLAMLKVIAKAGHICVDDIYLKIKNDFPSLSLATVYKNVNSMKEAEILYEIHTQDSKSMFEIKKQAHAHFVCQVCGNVEDREINEDDFRKYGKFNQIDVYIYGICEKCSKEQI